MHQVSINRDNLYYRPTVYLDYLLKISKSLHTLGTFEPCFLVQLIVLACQNSAK